MARSKLSPLENPITTRKRLWDWLARPELMYFRIQKDSGDVTIRWGVEGGDLEYDNSKGWPISTIRGGVTHYQVTGEDFLGTLMRMFSRENQEEPEIELDTD